LLTGVTEQALTTVKIFFIFFYSTMPEGLYGYDHPRNNTVFTRAGVSPQGEVVVQQDLLAQRVESSGQNTYIGWAEPGSSTDASVWRVKRVYAHANGVTVTWADGNTRFDNVWDDHAILSYS
jgi:hypothetical protein